MPPENVLVAAVVGAICAGFVQGLSGFAFSLTALSIWVWAVPAQQAGPLAVFGSLIGQLLAFRTLREGLDLKKVAPFVIAGVIGVPAGAALLPHVDQTYFKAGLGLLLVIWAPAMLCAARLPHLSRGGVAGDAAAGAVGGVLGGLAGLAGVVPAIWAIVRGWPRETQRSTLQTFNLSMHVVTMTVYVGSGLIDRATVTLFAIVAPAMLIPTLIGIRFYRHISDLAFRRTVLVLLGIAGIVLLASAITTWT